MTFTVAQQKLPKMVRPMQAGSQCNRGQSGFILIGLLMLIIISGFGMVQVGVAWKSVIQREREQELLKVGEAYRLAIGRYYNQTPSVVKEYPPNLEALLLDKRFPNPRRHLRKMYIDPITQRDGWGIVEAPSGGVMGVYSLSDKAPFKTKGFRPHQHFDDSQYYGEWYFVYIPKLTN